MIYEDFTSEIRCTLNMVSIELITVPKGGISKKLGFKAYGRILQKLKKGEKLFPTRREDKIQFLLMQTSGALFL